MNQVPWIEAMLWQEVLMSGKEASQEALSTPLQLC